MRRSNQIGYILITFVFEETLDVCNRKLSTLLKPIRLMEKLGDLLSGHVAIVHCFANFNTSKSLSQRCGNGVFKPIGFIGERLSYKVENAEMISCHILHLTSKVLSVFGSSGFLAIAKQGYVRPGEANSSKISVEKS